MKCWLPAFFLFSQCFQNATSTGSLQDGITGKWVNCIICRLAVEIILNIYSDALFTNGVPFFFLFGPTAIFLLTLSQMTNFRLVQIESFFFPKDLYSRHIKTRLGACLEKNFPIPTQGHLLMPLGNKPFKKTVEKGEIARNKQFLLFPQCFLPIWITLCHFRQI